MGNFTIQEFLAATAQRDEARGRFELENPHMLEINLNGQVRAKVGAMIGYVGNVKFTREGMLEHGLGTLLKKAVSGEGMILMKVEGQGRVYMADKGKKIRILQLQEDTIFINGNDLLAFEETLKWDITLMRRVAGMLAGGLFNIKLRGSGLIAMTTHYEPLTLRVSPNEPIFTDPNATVAWSGSLTPEIVTNITFKTLLGRGSGEAIQMKFQGDGWVVLQPYEEIMMQQSTG